MARIERKRGWAVGCVALASVWGTAFNGDAFGQWGRRAVSEPTTRAATTARPMVAEASEKLERPSGRKAFLVGASDYNRDVVDLPCVKNDVEALAARLVEIGFEESDVVVLTDGGKYEDMPIKANIDERFAEFVDELRPGDFVVVYLSGHGIQASESKEAFFAPVDVKAENPFETSTSIDKMAAALEASDARFRLLIVDACRNEPSKTRSMFKIRAAAPEGARSLVGIENAPKSVSLLQSCEPGEYSYEGGEGIEHGLFTQSLLEALDPINSKANANGDQELTFGEIFTYVSARTNELAKTLHSASQKPRLNNKDGFTDFVVLEKLTRDGVSDEQWREAREYYERAVQCRVEKRYRDAKIWIAKARAVNAVNPEYVDEEERITELLEMANQAAQAAAQAEQARVAAEQSRQAAQYAQPQTGVNWGNALDAARNIPYVGGYLPF